MNRKNMETHHVSNELFGGHNISKKANITTIIFQFQFLIFAFQGISNDCRCQLVISEFDWKDMKNI